MSNTAHSGTNVMDRQDHNEKRRHTYHRKVYHLPDDEQEAQRLDLQHAMWVKGLDYRLFLAPLPHDITHALDIGAGTGAWAMEFADQFPKCEVLGVDLSPINPPLVPRNCHFKIDNVDSDSDWTYPPMDYVHSRMIVTGLRNWPRYFQRCYNALKPGGWLELQEYSLRHEAVNEVPKDDACLRWADLVEEAMSKSGVDGSAMYKFGSQLQEAGFVNINKKEDKWPLGEWSREQSYHEIGLCMRMNFDEALNGTANFLCKTLDMKHEDLEGLKEQCKASHKDLSKHRVVPVAIHYAQKPLEA